MIQISITRHTNGKSQRDAQKAMTGIIKLCQQNNIELVSYIYGDPDKDVVKKCITYYANILDKSGLNVNILKTRSYSPAPTQIQ